MRRFQRTSLLLCLVGAAYAVPAASHGDEWRVPRRDHGRTAVASGPVNLAAPNVAWRTFLGGAPTNQTVTFANAPMLQGLPHDHAVIARGGRFLALNMATQQTLWQTEVLGPGQVAGIADLDGDGTVEVVVQIQEHAIVLEGSTGIERWRSSLELVEQVGVVRVRDVDGDGLADVYIDNAIGAKWGIDAASVYSFASGQAEKLWDFPVLADPMTISSGTDALLDLNGDGEMEVVLTSFTNARVLRGSDGSLLTSFEAQGVSGWPFIHASAYAVDLDGQGDLELLLVQQNSHVASQVGPSISAYRVDVATGQNEFMWAVESGSFEAEFAATTDVATDLDGDGLSEVVFSFKNAADADWTTRVLSGSDGTLLQEISAARFEGAHDLDGESGAELVLAGANGLSVFKYTPSNLVPFAQLGSNLPSRRALRLTDSARRSSASIDHKLAVLPRPNKRPLLLAGEAEGDYTLSNVGSFRSLEGYELVGNEWQLVATHEPILGSITGLMTADFATRPYPQIAVGESTGIVQVLNQFMEVTNGLTWVDGSHLGTFVGGGFLRAAPLVASDAQGPFILLSGTALGTVAADASYASWIIPPVPRWWNPNLSSSAILELSNGTRVVGVEHGTTLVSIDSQSGTAAAPITMPSGFAWGAPVALRNGAQTLVGIDWRNYGGEIHQTAVDFETGATSFVGAPILTGGFFGSSVGDLNSDGIDEWYSMTFASLWQRSSETGQATAIASMPDMNYSLPMVTESPAGDRRLLLQAGYEGPALVSGNGAVAWQADLNKPVNGMAGVVLTCGSSQRYVTPAVLSSTLTFYEVSTGAMVGSRTYAHGMAYATVEAANAAGKSTGIFSNVNGVANLDGSPAAVVGSSDGHLYVIDPCSMDVRWSANLGVSVGEPVIADSDGDGEDEILVGGADGFLYGLDNFSFPAPFISLAGQAESGPTMVEVGQLLNVEWEQLEGVTSYEVALIGPDDKPVWDPAYASVNETSTTIDLSGALAARPYRVVVRAGGDNPGQEAISVPFMLNDHDAPSLTAVAQNGANPVLELTAKDNVALDVALVSVEAQENVTLVAESALQGADASTSLSFEAPPSTWGMSVNVKLLVTDSAGLGSALSLAADVSDSGFVTFSSQGGEGSPVGRPTDWSPSGEEPESNDEEDSAGPRYGVSGGCACEVSGPTSTRGGWLMLGLAALVLTRARTSRRGAVKNSS